MNDIIFFILFLASLGLMLMGLTFIFGLGWATLIMNLIWGGTPSHYDRDQYHWPSAKKASTKVIGLIMIILGILLIIYLTS